MARFGGKIEDLILQQECKISLIYWALNGAMIHSLHWAIAFDGLDDRQHPTASTLSSSWYY
ncbi:hypothetical protein BT69DRAFT_1283068 [Atractiella rhizophila]|nr:hypothetical protein BT69DRAFT_1283068 [Atractiella rhizophila]